MTLLSTTRRANDLLSKRTMEMRLLSTTTMPIRPLRKRAKANHVIKNKQNDK